MKQLRSNLVFLVGYFFLLFVLLYGGYVFRYEFISIFAVLLSSLMISIDILTPKNTHISRRMTWLLTYIFYLIWLLLSTEFQPLNEIQSVYRVFTELFVLTIGINLSGQISSFLADTQGILQQVTFSRLQPAIHMNTQLPEVAKEIGRARRYGRPLALLLVDANSRLTVDNKGERIHQLQAEMLENYFEARVGHEILKLTRSTDIVAKAETLGRFFVLCPETTLRSVTYLGERISMVIDEKLSAEIHWGVVDIDDATASFELACEAAERDLMNRSMNDGIRFKGENDLANFLAEYQNEDLKPEDHADLNQ